VKKRCVTKRTKPLIAIVDDDESVCRAIKRLVRSAGMEANTFTSGQEFIDLVEGMPWLRVECVVLDVQMPKLNGLEVQERLAQNKNAIPVIFITAHDEPGVREKALAAGAVAFLRKPFNDELFIKTLREAIKRGAIRN
jgi:FixJ family two-component response regulator